MKRIIVCMHTSLDGFVAGLNGEMDWIHVDDAMFDLVATITNQADTALYGRVTYQMMQSYWPTAGKQPNASKHDIEHSMWYNNAAKIVLSTTIGKTAEEHTTVIYDNLTDNIYSIKQQDGKNIVVFGSPTAFHSLLHQGLIDEIWLFVNPVILGRGIPLFKGIPEKIALKLVENTAFSGGVMALHYEIV